MTTFRFDVRFEGLKPLVKKMDAATADAVLRRSLTKGGFVLQGWSQRERLSGPRPRILGVVTNRLRSSVTVLSAEKSGDTYVTKIGTNVEYAPKHEFGEGALPARPFLRPALEDPGNQQAVLDILTENINNAIKRAK